MGASCVGFSGITRLLQKEHEWSPCPHGFHVTQVLCLHEWVCQSGKAYRPRVRLVLAMLLTGSPKVPSDLPSAAELAHAQ